MALSKTLAYKGHDYSYWVIGAKEYDKKTNRTRFALWGYRDKEAREENIENYIPEFSKIYEVEWDKSTGECYAIAKQSVISKQITKVSEPAKTRVIQDEEGKDIEEIIEPEQPEQFEMVELNPLVNSLDI